MALTEKKMFDHKGGFELDDMRGEKLHMVCLKGAELHGVDARDTSLGACELCPFEVEPYLFLKCSC